MIIYSLKCIDHTVRFLQIGFPWIQTLFVHLLHLLAAGDWDALRHAIASLLGIIGFFQLLVLLLHYVVIYQILDAGFKDMLFISCCFEFWKPVCSGNGVSFWFKGVHANCLCASLLRTKFTCHVMHRACALRTKVNNNRVKPWDHAELCVPIYQNQTSFPHTQFLFHFWYK